MLTLTSFLDKLKPKSVLVLFCKVVELAQDPDGLKKNQKFEILLSHIASNWSRGDFAPGRDIKDFDRIMVLSAMEAGGLRSNRILGETTNLVVNGKINNPDVVCQIMKSMARFRYEPEDSI